MYSKAFFIISMTPRVSLPSSLAPPSGSNALDIASYIPVKAFHIGVIIAVNNILLGSNNPVTNIRTTSDIVSKIVVITEEIPLKIPLIPPSVLSPELNTENIDDI